WPTLDLWRSRSSHPRADRHHTKQYQLHLGYRRQKQRFRPLGIESSNHLILARPHKHDYNALHLEDKRHPIRHYGGHLVQEHQCRMQRGWRYQLSTMRKKKTSKILEMVLMGIKLFPVGTSTLLKYLTTMKLETLSRLQTMIRPIMDGNLSRFHSLHKRRILDLTVSTSHRKIGYQEFVP
ncbi:hypothetical protein JG688_00004743, partial [Phytophthora aleatoria]